MTERIVHCRKLNEDLPGLEKAPYKNELGQTIYETVSKKAWDAWKTEAVRLMNTYRVDPASPQGVKFMLKQCGIYFGIEEGEAARVAWTPPSSGGEAKAEHSHSHHEHGPDCKH
jgi:Fe-S cluster biosynthesis and repair protein YggX